jgi:hypothetical protein
VSTPQPADPVTAEDTVYAAIVSEYIGLRRSGASVIAAALLTSAYRVLLSQVQNET